MKKRCTFASAIKAWPVRLSVRTPGFHPGKGGSIPPRATKISRRSVRLGVRTPGFHPGNRGSIPLRTTS